MKITKYLKIIAILSLLIIVTSCSWFKSDGSNYNNKKEPIILIEQNTVLHDGFETNMLSLSTDLNHKFLFKIKSNETVTITKITYKVKIPNYKEIFQGTFYDFKQITIDKDFDSQKIFGLTERFSTDKFCEQISAINDSDEGLTNMRIDLKFFTKEKGEILIRDLILDLRKDSLFVKIMNFVQGKTYDVRLIIKEFFGI